MSRVCLDVVDLNSIPNDNESESGGNSDRRVTATNQNIHLPNFCESKILQVSNGTNPNIQSISVQNSSQTQIGNKTIYNAPVTIQQFVTKKPFFDRQKFMKIFKLKLFNKKVAIFVVAGILICCFLTLLFFVLRNDESM